MHAVCSYYAELGRVHAAEVGDALLFQLENGLDVVLMIKKVAKQTTGTIKRIDPLPHRLYPHNTLQASTDNPIKIAHGLKGANLNHTPAPHKENRQVRMRLNTIGLIVVDLGDRVDWP